MQNKEKKKPSAQEVLEKFYGLPLDQIPTQPPEEDEVIDWGIDVGLEIIDE